MMNKWMWSFFVVGMLLVGGISLHALVPIKQNADTEKVSSVDNPEKVAVVGKKAVAKDDLASDHDKPPATIPEQVTNGVADADSPFDKAQESLSAPPMTELSPSGVEQLKKALSEKEQRPLNLQKVDSGLLGLIPGSGSLGIDSAEAIPSLDLVVTAQVDESLLLEIERLGGHIHSVFQEHDWVRLDIAPSALESLAGLDQVRFIRRYVPPMLNKVNVSEGDVAHRASIARAGFDIGGMGVKVGVISDSASASQLSTLISSGDLPAGRVTVLPGQESSGSDEGLAMLEIVYDLVPGAELYFATANGGEPVFASNIRALRDAGCNVIVDDVGYFLEPAFEDGVIAEAVNEVEGDGVVYLSSAGNSGNDNDGQSGVWEGDFRVYQTMNIDGAAYETHDFGSGDLLQITACNGTPIILKWSDRYGASGNDYDLFLVDSSGQVAASSSNIQNGNDDPCEGFQFNVNLAGYYLLIARKAGEQTRFLHLNTNRGRLASGTAGQIYGHSAAEGCIAVAAVDANAARGSGGVFDGREPVETFSSDGPRRVFYDANGSAITSGNYTSSGGAVRNKPDFAAADGVKCATSGFGDFHGTSAAAPHAAAIVALMLDKNPGLSVPEIRQALIAGSMDIEGSGWDRDSGHGLLNAYTVLQNTPSAGLSAPIGISATKGAYIDKVQISWGAVSGATHYQVYRAISASGMKTPLGSWQSGNAFDDTTASAGTVYWYWVQAAESTSGANASTYSAADTGYRKEVTQLSTPAGVMASDGTLESMVSISWNAVSGATHYSVYRATSIGGEKTTLGSWQTSRTYYDTSAVSGTTYYYWVKAAASSSGANASEYSTHDSGFRKVESTATGSLSSIYWSEELDDDGDGYTHQRKLHFSTTLSVAADIRFKVSQKTGSTWTTYFENSGSLAGTVGLQNWNLASVGSAGLSHNLYDWKVELYEDTRLLDSESADGDLVDQKFETAAEDDSAPTRPSISASNGDYESSVRLNCSAKNATHYKFYRSDSVSGVKAEITDWVVDNVFWDSSVARGAVYYYWAKSAASDAGLNASDFSEASSGYVPLLTTPVDVSASDGIYSDKVVVDWPAVPGATHYRIYRSDSWYTYKQALSGWQTQLEYEDTTGDVGRNYNYWVRAANSSSGANASLYGGDEGRSENNQLVARIQAELGTGAIKDFAITGDDKVYTLTSAGLYRWDLLTGVLLRKYTDLPQISASNISLALSADESRVAVIQQFGDDYILDARTGEVLSRLQSGVRAGKFLNDPNLLVGIDGESPERVTIWDIGIGAVVGSFDGHTSAITSISLSEDGSMMATLSGYDETARVWDVASQQCLVMVDTTSGLRCVLSQDGSSLVLGCLGSVEIYDVDTGAMTDSHDTNGEYIYSMAFSPDGAYLYGQSKIWELDTWTEVFDFQGQLQTYPAAKFVHDGAHIAGVNGDGKISLYEYRYESGVPAFYPVQAHSNEVKMIAAADGAERVISGTWEGEVKVLDITDGSEVWSRDMGDYCLGVDITDDGSRVLVAMRYNGVELWDVDSNQLIRSIPAHAGDGIENVYFSPDETKFVTCGWDDTAKVWDVATGQCEATLISHANCVNCAVFSPDGSIVYTGGKDSDVRMWDVATGTCLKTFNESSYTVTSIALAGDGTTLACSQVGGPFVWDVSSGNLLYKMNSSGSVLQFSDDNQSIITSLGTCDLQSGIFTELISVDGYIYSSAISSNGCFLGLNTGEIDHWIPRKNSPDVMPCSAMHTDDLNDVAVSSDGQTIVTASRDGTVIIWDANTGVSKVVFEHEESVYCCDISDDGRYVAASDADRMLRVWDLVTSECIFEVDADSRSDVEFFHSGDLLITTSSDEIKLWSVPDGELMETWEDGGGSLAISDDDSLVATCSDGIADIWDASSGSLLYSHQFDNQWISVREFSVDGSKLLMTSGNDVGIWDVVTGDRLKFFEGHSLTVLDAAFSPDDLHVISGAYDDLVKVWDVTTEQCVKNCIGHSDSVQAVAYLPDGRFVSVEGGAVGTRGIIWQLVDPDNLHEVHIAGGFGSGQYSVGETVYIGGVSPSSAHQFAGWQGDVGVLANMMSEEASFVMPNQDVSLDATYVVQDNVLTVNNGSGSGTYPVGHVVAIASSAPPPGQTFNLWIGDTDYLADISATNTTVIMPDHDVSITATYRTPGYTLTVNNGSGGGSYALGGSVSLVADAPPSGERFDAWTGDTNVLADASSASTSLLMPAHDVSVTATYTGYRLTIENGNGSGVYPSGQSVAIVAEEPPSGQVFERWSGDVGFVDNLSNLTANVAMPASNVTLQATYTTVADDPFGYPETYPTVGMNILGRVELFGQAASDGDIVAVFSGTELRGKGEVIVEETFSGVNLSVQVAQNGELLTFKLWDSNEGVVYEVSPDCNVNAVSGTTLGSYPDGLVPIFVSDDIVLNMDLSAGWNQVSFNIDFEDYSIRNVLSNVLGSVSMAKGLNGSFDPDLPDAWNTLVDFAPANGFWLHMTGNESLALTGSPLERATATIQLIEGWNHVGYPLSGAADVRVVLADALSSSVIDRVTDSSGSFNPHVPDMVNSLTQMRPGRGYWIKANQPYLLTFNANTASALTMLAVQSSSALVNGIPSPHPFGDPVVYPNPVMTVLADVKLYGSNAVYGDVVAAYVGNELRGVQQVDIMFDKAAIATMAVNVNADGEDIRFKIWDASAERVFGVPDVVVASELGGAPFDYPESLLKLDTPYGVDDDTDNIPDHWETNYFGHVTNCVADADADGDGQSNLREYVFGTDPTNRLDADVFSMTSGSMEMDVRTCEKRWYTIEGTDDLMSSNWMVLARFFGTGTNMMLLDPDADELDSQYYRIKAEVMPDDPATYDSDGDGMNDMLDSDPFSKDSDGDGMPDGWEQSYSLNASVSNSVVDSDNDGYSDYAEYVLGTLPNDGDSRFFWSSSNATVNGQLQSAFLVGTASGRVYWVEHTPSLTGSWKMMKRFGGDGGTNSFILQPASNEKGYFRIRASNGNVLQIQRH
ncbi:InlB B-repeat-containing protein [Pontiella sulfatireligans]|uniref:Fervidolysin n=1 Tax=Pontiella sulfatireligans TaxID=2750658 RepID=A0A6C2UE31_9BACT|nr:S8 family serine peptidase [Pontiella sulfatireligans]VGO18430.1 Fervidolysin [Pontiella sulfatireligans]